jgi:predicted small lipoprotein YifL
MKLLVVLFILIAGLSACGVRGDPEPPPAAGQAE